MSNLNLFSESIVTNQELEFFNEESKGKKDLFIEGIFAQADIVNNNKRLYPSKVLMPQIESFIENRVKPGVALGELDHPERLEVHGKHASHLITEMTVKGSDVYGKAKIAKTPTGDIVKGLLETGMKLSVSTRGAGKTKKRSGFEEMELYYLSTVDIVTYPGAPDAFVNGVNESMEFLVENGHLTLVEADKILVQGSEHLKTNEFQLAIRRIIADL